MIRSKNNISVQNKNKNRRVKGLEGINDLHRVKPRSFFNLLQLEGL